MRERVNHCPNCNAVTYGRNGWFYAGRYNSTRFCVVCGTAMDEVEADQEFIELWKEKHEKYKEGKKTDET